MKNLNISSLSLITLFCGIIGVVFYFLEFNTDIFIWEFYFNWQVIVFISLLLFFYSSEILNYKTKIIESVRIFKIKSFFILLLLPLVASIFLIIIGLLFKELKFGEVNDTALFIFGIIFDLPAILFFALTSIFIEEVIFRILIFKKLNFSSTKINIIVLNLLFVLFHLDEIFIPFFEEEKVILMNIVLLINFYFFIGLASTLIYYFTKSIWNSYTFRIGVIAISQMLSSSISFNSNPYFVFTNPIFYLEGFVYTTLILVIIFLSKKLKLMH